MDKYLTGLIERMSATSDQILEAGCDGSMTISWNALREAEKIDNITFIPQLILLINSEMDKNKRSNAYFLLGHIAKNPNNFEALRYLIARVNNESDKYIISSLLERIASIKKPPGTDLQPLLQATRSGK